jgi:hypothetical protein
MAFLFKGNPRERLGRTLKVLNVLKVSRLDLFEPWLVSCDNFMEAILSIHSIF